MRLFRLSLIFLRRDWQAGEWRLLLLALVLAVGSLATVGLLTDRVSLALEQQAQNLLGADLRITSTRPFPPEYRKLAEAQGLRVVESYFFPSMVAHAGQVLLAEIQTVEPGHPLRGQIEIDDGNRHAASAIPARGTVWVDERLRRRLRLAIGDGIDIGTRRFRIAAYLVRDIDQAIGFASFAPRILMHHADAPDTGLLQPGSRLSYRLMVAGEASGITAFRKTIGPRLNHYEKLEDVRDARPELRSALERAEHFLGLAALTAAMLAGIAMALAARRFVSRHLDGCAVMRCMGAQPFRLLGLFLYQFIVLGTLAVLLGAVLGYAVQEGLVRNISSLREAGLPSPEAWPLFKAAVSGLALLLGFTLLPLLQLRRVSPMRVLRRELGLPAVRDWPAYGLALSVLTGLFLWYAGSLRLGLTVLTGLLAGLLLFGGLAFWLVRASARKRFLLQPPWRQAVNHLARHGYSTAIQVAALSLGGMALLLLTLVRNDLLEGWQSRLPPDTPNRFLVSIQPDQVQALRDFFVRHALPVPDLFPVVRGRLIAINNRPIRSDSFAGARARALVEREFNLSYMHRLPAWNETVEGIWKPDGKEPQLSVEEGIAQTLGIRLGDTLTYDVAGSTFTARVHHLRKVQWDSMRVNFFVIASPDVLQDFPASHLCSIHLPPDKAGLDDELVRTFPNVLVINTDTIINQVRGIMDQIAKAVSVVFLFTLLSGLTVLYAALLVIQDERIYEAAILRALGADGAWLRGLHLAGFALLGLLSGLFAAAGAVLLGWVLARLVLDIPWQTGGAVWFIGAAWGVIIVGFFGWLATRSVRQTPPLAVLRAE